MDFYALRLELGLTQQECADGCGVSRPRWAQYESGEHRPSPETGWRIIEMAAERGKRLKLEDIFPRNGQ